MYTYPLRIVNRLQEDQQKRIIPKFNDEENFKIDKDIRQNIFEMTKKIRECEDNIKVISQGSLSSPQEQESKNVRINLNS